ncbi:relaxase/mobilization nuclease domain-containing protein [Pelagovum pacificum]|uniref:MobA/VirD2-like nuclease domain-containing protein n=1 Tax=Pelagovum pacificum TaxID=2588711 RepID=A0A5C5G8Q7_9RHOB|nr:relaxase/mobilization nuclease domain-containing protein [Pelagovum pacificum]QQA45103.1 relaxase/mobilization nuclease domain-containing protein [Pelagovum pacificum]TNY30465.1 hypothetical protein FHY64_20085 [Pelagovum pacificum]
MIVKATQGASFKGVGAYLLHDKGAATSERVAFVETANLPTDDAARAIAHMIDTATHADALKRAAGVKVGKAIDKPVYHYSLAWHPSEAPSMADQVQAARDTLKALGMADRQALIVAHNDTDHPHVHVVVNRVCAETGRAASTGNDRLKLSNWALAYRRQQGMEHLCPARASNDFRRRVGEFVKDASPTRQTYLEWKKAQTAELWEQHRAETAAMKPDRKTQFEALWQQKEARFAARRAEVKELWRPIWRDVFRRQRDELEAYDRRLSVRLRHARRLSGSSIIKTFRAVVNDQVQRADFIKTQEAERKALASRQGQTVRDAGREITKAWRHDRDQLRAAHRAQDTARYEATRGKVDDVWKRQQKDEQAKGEEHVARNPSSVLKDFDRKKDPERVKAIRERTRSKARKRTRKRGDEGRTLD